MKVHYNKDYTASRYAFETTRKSQFVAEAIKDSPNIQIIDPSPFYEETIGLIGNRHQTGYVLAVRDGNPLWLAESQGFDWDEGIYTMAVAHNAGIVAAIDTVLSEGGDKIAGSLSSGLHHAETGMGKGFCTFNGLAVGAAAARKRGAIKILCIDFDAHCGGGTYKMTRDLGLVQIDVSTSAFDSYEIEEGDKSRLHLLTAEDYIEAVTDALAYADEIGPWDIVLYNAGMDPVNTGATKQEMLTRERMVANWAKERGYPTVFTLAGGYLGYGIDMDDIVELHSMTATEFAKDSVPAS